jgi:hypothetical protein
VETSIVNRTGRQLPSAHNQTSDDKRAPPLASVAGLTDVDDQLSTPSKRPDDVLAALRKTILQAQMGIIQDEEVDDDTTGGEILVTAGPGKQGSISAPSSVASGPVSNAVSPAPSTAIKEPDVNDTAAQDARSKAYYYHAQQAMALAAQGGLAGVYHPSSMIGTGATADEGSDDLGDGVAASYDGPPEIGRSLFLSLDVTTWEEDEEIVLEVGWAGVWWQEKLDTENTGGDNVSQKSDVTKTKAKEFEEMRNAGHWM